jgi:hypothetical protein
MDESEYRNVEARLDEALAIFAEREQQFSALILQVRDNVARVRGEVAALRSQSTVNSTRTSRPWSQ